MTEFEYNNIQVLVSVKSVNILKMEFYMIYKHVFLNLCEIGERMKGVSGDPRETAYLFQRVSVIVQRANAIALHGTFVMEEPDD